MVDRCTGNLAKILVRYCIEAECGQTVSVAATPAAEPLVEALYENLLQAGAFPVIRMRPDTLGEIFFRHAKPFHFQAVPPFEKALARSVDATIRVYSQTNTRALSSASPHKQMELARIMHPVMEIIRKKPWVLTLYPTTAYAQDADMSMGDFEAFVFEATFADRKQPLRAWRALRRRQDQLIAKLRGADKVRIVGDGTDLSLSIRRRTFVNSDGRRNMPSGEIFTSPIESSAEGTIVYDYPVCHAGREIDGIRLVFRHGEVVEAGAKKNEAYLKAMLKTDRGACRLGELGIGTNERIQRFTKNILFDEKIGGTVHLALGRGYPETGSKNRSALHWDMIKDLRRGGALYIDGKIFQKDGKFVA